MKRNELDCPAYIELPLIFNNNYSCMVTTNLHKYSSFTLKPLGLTDIVPIIQKVIDQEKISHEQHSKTVQDLNCHPFGKLFGLCLPYESRESMGLAYIQEDLCSSRSSSSAHHIRHKRKTRKSKVTDQRVPMIFVETVRSRMENC